MKVSLSEFNLTTCKKLMDNINPDTNLCFGGDDKGGFGTCTGDSGGPLQCQSSDGKWYQIGIISWGISCARANIPDVYTRVAYFYDWIEEVINKN
jgi:secreted trypsin-like serine protease